MTLTIQCIYQVNGQKFMMREIIVLVFVLVRLLKELKQMPMLH